MAENHFSILCVDDEPAVLRPLEIMLRRRGFQVLTANGGGPALQLFRENKVDAVVLDYAMPEMSGGEIARAIRQQNATVPIILHTGYKDIDDPLLVNVTCTLPKGSLSFLVTKLHDLLGIVEHPQGAADSAQSSDGSEAPPASEAAHSAA